MRLELRDIRKSVIMGRGRELTVLDGVNLQVEEGESVAILGRSGSGKSTLLAVLGLLEPPTAGSYLVDGIDTREFPAARLARLRANSFGFVFQSFCLMSHLTALENVEAATIHQGKRRAARRKRATDLLEQVGMAERRHHRPPQLSGGEQQRVAIARALSGRPSVILADEPTGSLDQGTGTMVIAQLHRLVKEHQVVLVVVTHDPVVADGCHRTVVLDRGRVLTG